MIHGLGPHGWNIHGEYRDLTLEYIPAYLITKFSGYIFQVRGRFGYLKWQYSADTNLKAFSELVFSYNENGCEKCSFTMIQKPETLGFKIEDNDLIEIYIYGADSPAWSGVVNDPGNEYRKEGMYSFSAIGYAPRAKGYIIDDAWTGDSIGDIAADVAAQLASKDDRLEYDLAKIEPVVTTLTAWKADKKNILDTFKTLGDIAGNVIFKILGDRFVRFELINTDIVPGAVFHADAKTVNIQKIERSKTDKIKNLYILERKVSGGGSTRPTATSGTDADDAYSLNGTILAPESIFMYGEYMTKESLPETTNSDDAIKYGIAKCALTAFPTYKIELEVDGDYFDALVVADGSAVVYNHEELFIDLIENCEDDTRWSQNGGSAFTIANSDTRYEARHSIEIDGACAVDDYAVVNLPEDHDFSQVRMVTFWVYSDTGGGLFDVYFGESAPDEFGPYTTFITQTNSWQQIKIIVDIDADISTFMVKFISAGTYNIKIDKIEKQYMGRRKYNLMIKGVEYTFRANEEKIKFTLGSTERPFLDTFVDAWRSVEAQKNISNED